VFKKVTALCITFSFLLNMNIAFASAPIAIITDASIPKKDISGTAKGHELFNTDVLISENKALQLYLDEQNFVIKIRDLTNDFIWSSSISEDELETAFMSPEWINFSKSAIVIDYMDNNGGIRKSTSNKAIVKYDKSVINGFKSTLQFVESGITLDLVVTLEEDGINVNVPEDTIQINGKFILNKLYVLPFLGATHTNKNDGYIFIPDGSGALIRFTTAKPYTSSYIGRVYGQDSSVQKSSSSNMLISNMKDVYVPVFGMVHGSNQNGFVSIITDGDVYANIEASSAGNMIDYFWATPSFIYNELYWQPTSSKAGFFALPNESNKVNVNIKYKFLSDKNANYVGMANKYKEYLIHENKLISNHDDNLDIPIKIDALMSETKKSVFGKSIQIMTRITDLIIWVDYFNQNGISNISMLLEGYQKKGYSSHKLENNKLNKKIGSSTDAETLFTTLENIGGTLYFSVNPTKGYTNQVKLKNTIYSINGSIVSSFLRGRVYSEQYYHNTREELSIVESTSIASNYFKNISFSSIGNVLFSDYNRKNTIVRHEAKVEKENTLSITGNAGKVELHAPNVYAFKYANQVYDLPISTSMLVYETDTVPFLQILLSGYVNSFSSYLNLGANSEEDILKLIDYNTYPSYLFTDGYSHELSRTNLNHLYSTKFDEWKYDVLRDYKIINDVLRKVKGAKIINREVIEDEFVVVSYDNGYKILINYSSEAKTYKSNIIEKKSSQAIQGEI
jgi:hypothetical protein